MKWILVLTVAIIASTCAAPAEENETKRKLGQVHEQCQKDFPLAEDLMEKIRKHEKIENLPDNFGSHMLCMAKGMGTVTEDGKVNKEKVKERLEAIPGHTAENVEHVLAECVKDYETAEKTAVELGKCISTHNQAHENDHSHEHAHHH